MEILVTNDDGIDSPGLHNLADALREIGNIHVVAPAKQQSAVSHALTIEYPLRTSSYHLNGSRFGTAVYGTPSDCVKLAIANLLDKKPDLVVSGVNFGRNTSINIIYSGTVAAATEGMLVGIPSIAVSVNSHSRRTDTMLSAKYATLLAKEISHNPLFQGSLININVPDLPQEQIKGIKITRPSNAKWKDWYDKRQDPFERDYYWFSGEYIVNEEDLETDDYALLQGYVSVSPIKLKLADNLLIDELKKNNNFL
ncbi:5'/3'-nucleotidase SurE [Bacteroidetes/Chlorobi group bacterium ChocPot_Mid]|nr:MAG: 5'/3'-nucleotidase SurE [Bacteroidetes/Chlorobi group bacterium ChocPot_Mid]